MPDTAFVLFSHNSARTITRRFARRLRDARLVAWFAQNPAFEHPKLRAIPVGIPNPKWASGETAAIERVQREAPPKSNLFDVTFDVGTNPKERMRCVAATGLEPAPRRPFEDYLRGLASSHFCLSPPGKGIDAVRTWEALYLRTVPVVRRSVLTDQHPDLPWIVLDDWSQFKTIEFTPALYEQVWAGWDPARIRLDRYLKRVEAAIAELRLER